MANAPRSLVNETVGQFQIKEELGRGGMAVVYKGYQPSLDRWVAIKTLPAESSADRELVARFHREAEAMVQLNHSNIVQIIDKGQDKGLYYFAMEFVEGPSLKDLLKQETLSMDLMFDVAAQVCDGLAYAHKKGIVHRDIKPANILYEKSTGLAKVADFGIARKSDDLTLTTAGMGTMNYMAPEQREDARSVDHRADIYSLGVMVYEMFTGKLPLGRFKPASQLNAALPRKLDEVISKALETDPADRYQQMDELKADLQLAREASKGGTLVRSVRDAAERTLTAFAGDKAGGKGRLFACCLLFLLLGGGGGGAFVVADPMKLDLLAKVGLKGGGTPPTETPPPATETKPPQATETKPPPATETKPPPATETKPPQATETKPPQATETTPPQATETTPPQATETRPPQATETTPPQATETRPPPATETRPPQATETRPPQATETRPPQATETATPAQPTVKQLSAGDLAQYNQVASELERELAALEDAAKRVSLAALTDAIDAARTASSRAAKLKDEGAPEAVSSVTGARDELRTTAARTFSGAFAELRDRLRGEGADPAELRRIEDDYARLNTRSQVERLRGWADVVNRLHGLRVVRLTREARLALDMAAIRVDAEALGGLRGRLDEATALVDQGASAAALERVLAAIVSTPGPRPERLSEVARSWIQQLTGERDQPFFYAICPAAGQRVAAIGPVQGQKVLFLCAYKDGQLQVDEQAPITIESPNSLAPAGDHAFWVGSALGSVHRVRLSRSRAEVEAQFTVPGRLLDLDTAPDGSLYVVTTREVLVFKDGARLDSVNIERDFVDSPAIPRRVAALVGGGWVVTGHVPTAQTNNLWGEFEKRGDWELTLRGKFPGDQTVRALHGNLSAVAACGDGFLAAQHRDKGDLVLLDRGLTPAAAGLIRDPSKSLQVAQDVAVSGRLVYVLEYVNTSVVPQFRRKLAVYEME